VQMPESKAPLRCIEVFSSYYILQVTGKLYLEGRSMDISWQELFAKNARICSHKKSYPEEVALISKLLNGITFRRQVCLLRHRRAFHNRPFSSYLVRLQPGKQMKASHQQSGPREQGQEKRPQSYSRHSPEE